MFTAQPQKAGHCASSKHSVRSCNVRSQRPTTTHFSFENVDCRAAWSKACGPSSIGFGCGIRTTGSIAARLSQPPKATSNGSNGVLRVVVSGGSGLIGSKLVAQLSAAGHTVLVLTRDAAATTRKLRYPNVQVFQPSDWKSAISGSDAVVNLAGEPIATRWSEQIKQQIMQSRVGTTKLLVDAINATPEESRPKVLVSSSAVGFYGVSENATFDESSPPGGDFLSEVCQKWEAEANRADTRVVIIRTGIVMSTEGGALAKMLPIFELFLGGPLGTGDQWMSWVHIDDLVGLLAEAVTNESYSGVYNGTAPNPVRMSDLCASIASQLNKPSWLPVPAFAIQGLLAEGAQTVLNGQRVLPKKAQQAGYQFQHPRIQEALKSILA